MLVDAKHQWPQAINAHLWPYSLWLANEVHMHTPLKQTREAPLDLFLQVASTSAPKHFHPFGCPVYVLSECMQASAKGPKWEEWAWVGIYIGNSPLHACSITLILNIETGLTSPQFHINWNSSFTQAQHSMATVHWLCQINWKQPYWAT